MPGAVARCCRPHACSHPQTDFFTISDMQVQVHARELQIRFRHPTLPLSYWVVADWKNAATSRASRGIWTGKGNFEVSKQIAQTLRQLARPFFCNVLLIAHDCGLSYWSRRMQDMCDNAYWHSMVLMYAVSQNLKIEELCEQTSVDLCCFENCRSSPFLNQKVLEDLGNLEAALSWPMLWSPILKSLQTGPTLGQLKPRGKHA